MNMNEETVTINTKTLDNVVTSLNDLNECIERDSAKLDQMSKLLDNITLVLSITMGSLYFINIVTEFNSVLYYLNCFMFGLCVGMAINCILMKE